VLLGPFNIVHHKGSTNINADPLSWLLPPSCALTVPLPHYSLAELKEAYTLDPIISMVHKVQMKSPNVPHDITFKYFA